VGENYQGLSKRCKMRERRRKKGEKKRFSVRKTTNIS